MNNKRALITGASAGLGKEFARQLAGAGKNLILVARRREPMEELAAELRHDHGVEVEIMVADLSDSTAPASLLRETQEKGLEVDYLINNAGAEVVNLETTSSTTPALRALTLSKFVTGRGRMPICDS